MHKKWIERGVWQEGRFPQSPIEPKSLERSIFPPSKQYDSSSYKYKAQAGFRVPTLGWEWKYHLKANAALKEDSWRSTNKRFKRE